MVRRAAGGGRDIAYDGSVHPPQLSDIPTDNIAWTGAGISEAVWKIRLRGQGSHDTADQLNHTVSDATQGPDGKDLHTTFSRTGCG
jgi:hypothetical protein